MWKQTDTKQTAESDHQAQAVSTTKALLAHLTCGLGVAIALCVAQSFYSIDLVSDPTRTLRLLWVLQCPVVVLVYSWFRVEPDKCSYLAAAARGILTFPLDVLVGRAFKCGKAVDELFNFIEAEHTLWALVNAFGAIALGAPVGIQFLWKTIHWSLLMSSLTFVPAGCVFGSSWTHWQRAFACTKSNEVLYYLICIPAHGAVIGAWFGAWPMPLDWERPWQEWPICVTYGALGGYLVAMLVCFSIVAARSEQQHVKRD